MPTGSTLRHPYRSGFTLTELAMVLFIISLLFVFIVPSSTAYLDTQRQQLTVQRMKIIEAALINFVMVNRRLPCPTDGADNVEATRGWERRNNATGDCHVPAAAPAPSDQARGVVPWATLGLTAADTLDAWNNQITYRAAFGLTRDGILDMTACDPAGTADTATPNAAGALTPQLADNTINLGYCSSAGVPGSLNTYSQPLAYLFKKGFAVNDNATLIMSPTGSAAGAFNFPPVGQPNGAAFIVVSHGPNAIGAYSGGYVYIATPHRGIAGNLEQSNYATVAVTAASTVADPIFQDPPHSESGDPNVYFDDIVLRPSVLSLLQRAQLGPRSH